MGSMPPVGLVCVCGGGIVLGSRSSDGLKQDVGSNSSAGVFGLNVWTGLLYLFCV